MPLVEPRLDAVTCDARSIQDRARVAGNAELPEHPRLLFALNAPVVDFVLGWFATAAPRNVGAAVSLTLRPSTIPIRSSRVGGSRGW